MKRVLKGSLWILIYALLIPLSQLLAGIAGAAVGLWRSVGGINFTEEADVAALIRDVFAWLQANIVTVSFIGDLVLLFSLLLLLKLRHISPRERFGNRPLRLKTVIGIFFLLFSLSVFVGILFVLPPLSPYAEEHDEIMEALMVGNPLFLFLTVGLFAPFVEEVAFRGMIYKELRTFSPVWLSACLSALLFAVAHGNLMQGIYTFSAGLLLALVYERTGNLRAPVLLHILFNCTNFVPDFSQGAPLWAMLLLVILGIFAGLRLIRNAE